jgi:hypothetical protein
VSVSATDTLFDISFSAGLASAICYPTQVGLFVESVAAAGSPQNLSGCLDSLGVDALLPQLKGLACLPCS